jgi:hypothetical protein
MCSDAASVFREREKRDLLIWGKVRRSV